MLQARQLEEARQSAGFDQAALDNAARQGFGNGAFEDSEDDTSAIVEEFFPPEAEPAHPQTTANQEAPSKSSLAEKLEILATDAPAT